MLLCVKWVPLLVLLSSLASMRPALAVSVALPAGTELPSFETRLAYIESLGRRTENSPSEAAAFSYIETVCAAAGIETRSSGFGESVAGFSFSRILEVAIKGAGSQELAIVVGVDSWVDSAEGSEGSLAIALALSELERLSRASSSGQVPPVSLRFVFLGAEKRGRQAAAEVASLGSRTWIAREEGTGNLAVIYLDFDRYPAAVRLRSAGAGILSPFWLYDRARRALETSGLPLALQANRLMLYRLGLIDSYGPVRPYLEAGMPAIELSGEGVAAQPAKASAWFSSFIDSFLLASASGFPSSWDRHYIAFQLGSASAVVRETSYVGFLVLFSAAAAAAILLLTVLRRESTRLLLRRSPAVVGQLLALFVALAGIFLAEGGLAQLEALVLGSGEAWKLAPRLFAGARTASIFLLFLALLSILVERKALTANPYFYEFAALSCLGVDIYVFSAISLPLSFYFVWAFLVVALSLWARKPWATIVAYGIMYAPLLLLAGELFARPEYSVYVHIIAPGRKGVFTLAALTLPFFTFTVSPLLFYAPHGAMARKRVALIFLGCALALEGLLLAYAVLGPARAGPGAASPFGISETVDQDSGQFSAVLSAERRLGKGTIRRAGFPIGYESLGDHTLLSGADESKRLRFRESRDLFLDRVTEHIGLSFTEAPYGLSLNIQSETELHIYDCNFPFRVALDGHSASIDVGVNPGPAVDIALTVPGDFRAGLLARAIYLSPPAVWLFPDGSSPKPGQFQVLASTEISAGAAR